MHAYIRVCIMCAGRLMLQTDINDCASEPCRHGGTCTDGVNEYTCACVDGWIGDRCEKIRDNCEVDSCQQGSKCLSVFPGVSCRSEPLPFTNSITQSVLNVSLDLLCISYFVLIVCIFDVFPIIFHLFLFCCLVDANSNL